MFTSVYHLEPKRVDLEDDFPLQKGDFVQVPAVTLQRMYIKMGGVRP